MALPKRLRHRDPTLPGKIPGFSARPIQIRALLKAMDWSQYELGRYVGVVNRIQDGGKRRGTVRTSLTVSRWVTGKARPSRVFRQRMCQLVTMVKKDYLRILKEMKNERNKSQ